MLILFIILHFVVSFLRRRQTARGRRPDTNGRRGFHVFLRIRSPGPHVRHRAPWPGRPGRGAADQQRRAVVRATRTAARPAAVLFRRPDSRRPVPRHDRVQRAGHRGHVPHSDAADGRHGRRPTGPPRAPAVVRRTFVTVATAPAAAAADTNHPRRGRHQRVVPLGSATHSPASRVQRYEGTV